MASWSTALTRHMVHGYVPSYCSVKMGCQRGTPLSLFLLRDKSTSLCIGHLKRTMWFEIKKKNGKMKMNILGKKDHKRKEKRGEKEWREKGENGEEDVAFLHCV